MHEWVNVRQYCEALWIKALYKCSPFNMSRVHEVHEWCMSYECYHLHNACLVGCPIGSTIPTCPSANSIKTRRKCEERGPRVKSKSRTRGAVEEEGAEEGGRFT